MYDSVVESPYQSTRNEAANKILCLLELACNQGNSVGLLIFDVILGLLPRLSRSSYLEGFGLVSQALSVFDERLGYNKHAMVESLCDYISHRPITEASADDVDVVLTGYLKVLTVVLCTGSSLTQEGADVWESKRMCSVLLQDCIFSLPTQANHHKQGSVKGPKCKSAVNRQAAFQLILVFCKCCPKILLSVLEFMSPYQSLEVFRLPPGSSMKYSAADCVLPKGNVGYCGLVNPGCICYMISCLQQFYMVPTFRQAILNIPFGEGSGFAPDDDSFLYQLQLTFASLQESEQFAYDLGKFCNSFKDFEGAPTNIGIQQDASEFLTNFFQQLENDTVGSSHENILKETFGGLFSNELLAAGGKYSERLEQFYFISLSIAGRNLQESLNAFIQGETVDYTWETSDPASGAVVKESLPTTKRVSIAQPPNHLLLHLKRFAFDFETMMQVKLNTRFEFPVELNVFAYTKQHRSDSEEKEPVLEEAEPGPSTVPQLVPEDCIYSLAGVVVHSGTANSGHYYSYIKERGCFASAAADEAVPRTWFEFNDSFVTEFDSDELDSESFGGCEGEGTDPLSGGRQKTRSAFMLVYDRQKAAVPDPSAVVIGDGGGGKYLASVQEPLLTSLWLDNVEYWNTRNLFDPSHLQFVSDLLDVQLGADGALVPPDDCSSRLLQCATHYTLSTLVRAEDTAKLAMWLPRLSKYLLASPEAAEQFLCMLMSSEQGGCVSSRDLLLSLSEPQSQRDVMNLVSEALGQVMPKAVGRLEGSTAVAFLRHLTLMLRDAQKAWRNIRYFFQPFYVFAQYSEETAAFSALDRGDMTRLLAFMMGELTNRTDLIGGTENKGHKSRAMSDGFTIVPLDSLLQALQCLVNVYVIAWQAIGRVPSSPLELMPDEDRTTISSAAFLLKLMKHFTVYRTKSLAERLLQVIVFGSEGNSRTAISQIINSLKFEDGMRCKGPMRAAMLLLDGKLLDIINFLAKLTQYLFFSCHPQCGTVFSPGGFKPCCPS